MSTPVEFVRVGKLLKAFVDDQELDFGVDDKASANFSAGDHSLTWVIVGAPGDSYTISITAPTSVAFTHTGTLDSSKRDAGVQWFAI